MCAVYGKPVIAGPQYPENPYTDQRSFDQEVDHNGASPAFQGPPGPSVGGAPPETERTPRPLSPTKLLPFISNPYRHQSDGDLEALRKKLYNAPRPLKKRSSITEPEGPAGPNIQKLLYQKATLAALETIINTPSGEPERAPQGGGGGVAGAVQPPGAGHPPPGRGTDSGAARAQPLRPPRPRAPGGTHQTARPGGLHPPAPPGPPGAEDRRVAVPAAAAGAPGGSDGRQPASSPPAGGLPGGVPPVPAAPLPQRRGGAGSDGGLLQHEGPGGHRTGSAAAGTYLLER